LPDARARVLATSSSDAKLDRVRAMGADHVVNYKTNPDWHKVAREVTNGVGVDLVVEVAGTLDSAVRAVRTSGTVALIGVLAGAVAQLSLGAVVTQNIRLQGVTVGSRELFEDMTRAMELHGTEPPVDERRFAFEGVGAAIRLCRKASISQGLQPFKFSGPSERARPERTYRRATRAAGRRQHCHLRQRLAACRRLSGNAPAVPRLNRESPAGRPPFWPVAGMEGVHRPLVELVTLVVPGWPLARDLRMVERRRRLADARR
jgi:hypothetical protein